MNKGFCKNPKVYLIICYMYLFRWHFCRDVQLLILKSAIMDFTCYMCLFWNCRYWLIVFSPSILIEGVTPSDTSYNYQLVWVRYVVNNRSWDFRAAIGPVGYRAGCGNILGFLMFPLCICSQGVYFSPIFLTCLSFHIFFFLLLFVGMFSSQGNF